MLYAAVWGLLLCPLLDGCLAMELPLPLPVACWLLGGRFGDFLFFSARGRGRGSLGRGRGRFFNENQRMGGGEGAGREGVCWELGGGGG